MLRFLIAITVLLVGCQKIKIAKFEEPAKPIGSPKPPVVVPTETPAKPPVAPPATPAGADKPASSGVAGTAKAVGLEEVVPASSKPGSTGFLKPIVCTGETYRVERKLLGAHEGLTAEGCLGEDANGRIVLTQRWAIRYPNGVLRSVQEYDRGVPTGTWRHWDTAGFPLHTFSYRDGELHGAYLDHSSQRYRGNRVNELEVVFHKGKIVSIDSFRQARLTVRTVTEGRRIEMFSYDESKKPVTFLVSDGAKVTAENGTIEQFLGAIPPDDLARLFLNQRALTRFSRNDRGEIVFYLSGGKTFEVREHDYYSWRWMGEKLISDLQVEKEKIDFDREHIAAWLRNNPSSLVYEWLQWTTTALHKSAVEHSIPMEALER